MKPFGQLYPLDNHYGNSVENIFAWSGIEGKKGHRGSGEVRNKAVTGAGEEVESLYLSGQFEFGKGKEGGV